MSDSTAQPPQERIALLVVSLCMNAALLVIILACFWRAMHPVAAQRGILSPYGLMRQVPAERERIQAILDSHTAELRSLRVASGDARLKAVDALGAPNYSPDKFETALKAVNTADAALEAKLVETMVESFATLSPAERKSVADAIRRRNRSWMFETFRNRAP